MTTKRDQDTVVHPVLTLAGSDGAARFAQVLADAAAGGVIMVGPVDIDPAHDTATLQVVMGNADSSICYRAIVIVATTDDCGAVGLAVLEQDARHVRDGLLTELCRRHDAVSIQPTTADLNRVAAAMFKTEAVAIRRQVELEMLEPAVAAAMVAGLMPGATDVVIGPVAHDGEDWGVGVAVGTPGSGEVGTASWLILLFNPDAEASPLQARIATDAIRTELLAELRSTFRNVVSVNSTVHMVEAVRAGYPSEMALAIIAFDQAVQQSEALDRALPADAVRH